MNKRLTFKLIGKVLLVEAALMLVPLAVSLILGGGDAVAMLISMLVTGAVGGGLALIPTRNDNLRAREGFAVVSFSWLLVSFFGALPFWIHGCIPSLLDAFFETVSGFTTTGATILTDVEALPAGLLFWRSFTHWVGGMGVLVFVMAILPMSAGDGHGMHLMRAEVPGPTVGKLVSRMGDTAKILYGIYLAMTVLEIVLLLAGGMPLYDACIHAFGTAGTGGFSCRNLSVGAYDSVYFDIVIGIFMLLFGVNFNLYYFLLIHRFRDVFHSEELRAYLGIVAAAVIAIAVDILHIYGSLGRSLRYAFFQVSSIITTTGFATADFNLWPSFSKAILVTLMFIGACAGSTGGGIKVARVVILCKTSLGDMRKMLHPNAVTTVRFEGKPLTDRSIRSVHLFLTVYILIFTVSVLLLSLERFDLITVFTAVAACINNIGPGLEVVGPMGNYAQFSPAAKLLLSFDMMVGRLEIFPMLLLFAPSIWKRRLISRKPAL